jgi:hypothetical protein
MLAGTRGTGDPLNTDEGASSSKVLPSDSGVRPLVDGLSDRADIDRMLAGTRGTGDPLNTDKGASSSKVHASDSVVDGLDDGTMTSSIKLALGGSRANQSQSAGYQAQAVIVGRAWDLLFKIANDLAKLNPANVPKDSSSHQGAGAEILNKRYHDAEVNDPASVDKAQVNRDPHSVDEKDASAPQGNPVIRSLLGNIAELEYNLIAWDLIYMFPQSKISSDSYGKLGVAKILPDGSTRRTSDSVRDTKIDLLKLLQRYSKDD